MLVMLALVVVAVIVNGHSSPTSVGRPTIEGSNPTATTTQSPSGPRSLTSDQQLQLEQSIGRMRDVVPVQAATSPRYPAVSSEARQQPDLYAAAFVRELLTQDYRTSRDQLLAWVQSESAQSTEPLVVGLTPWNCAERWPSRRCRTASTAPRQCQAKVTGRNWLDTRGIRRSRFNASASRFPGQVPSPTRRSPTRESPPGRLTQKSPC